MEEQNQQASTQVSSLPGAKELLKRAWKIYKERFSTFIAISAVALVVIPMSFLKPTAFIVLFPLCIALALAAIFLSVWEESAILFAVKDRNEKIGFKESFKRGLPKIWPLFLTGVLVGLAVLGGLILLIVPGIIFGIWFVFAGYLVVAENLSGKEALSRSKKLVKGNFWGVSGRIFAFGIIIAVISLIATGLFTFMFGKDIGKTLSSIVSIFIGPLGVVYMFLIYEELKKIKG